MIMSRITEGAKKEKIKRNIKEKIAISKFPYLEMPNIGEDINIRTLTQPIRLTDNKGNQSFVAKCEVLINNVANSMVLAPENLLKLTSVIYKGMLAEFAKNNIIADQELICMRGRVWTIKGVEWKKSKPPITYKVVMRKDLEMMLV